MFEWATFLESKEAFPQAEKQLNEAIDILKAAFAGSPDRKHWRTGEAYLKLGEFYQRRNNVVDAKKAFIEAKKIFDEVFDPGDHYSDLKWPDALAISTNPDNQ